MYHEVTLHPKDEHVRQEDGGLCQETTGKSCYGAMEKRQHVSGMEGVGLGVGLLYGLHRNIDLSVEVMYDLLFPSVANNFDFQLGLQFHF
jgi:hypothetical protein